MIVLKAHLAVFIMIATIFVQPDSTKNNKQD